MDSATSQSSDSYCQTDEEKWSWSAFCVRHHGRGLSVKGSRKSGQRGAWLDVAYNKASTSINRVFLSLRFLLSLDRKFHTGRVTGGLPFVILCLGL